MLTEVQNSKSMELGFKGDPDAMVVITRTDGQARGVLIIPKLDSMTLDSPELEKVLQKVRVLENGSKKEPNTDYVFVTKKSYESMLQGQGNKKLNDFVRGIDFSKVKVDVLE